MRSTKTKALQKYTLAVNNANMKYLSDTNILVKSTQLLASGMQNISFKVSSQGVNEAKKSLSEVEKSITDLLAGPQRTIIWVRRISPTNLVF